MEHREVKVTRCEAGGCTEFYETEAGQALVPTGWFVRWVRAGEVPGSQGRLVVLCPKHRPPPVVGPPSEGP